MIIADLEINYDEFKERYIEAASDFNYVTRFWNTYNPNPMNLIKNRQFLRLRDRQFALLRKCKRIDADAFARIHKGHPFYFIGITSYYLDDYLTALYFFDAAVTEDIENGAEPKTNPTPATRFLMLDGNSNNQAAKELTQYAQTKVERARKFYQDEVVKGKNAPELTFDNLINDFIYFSLTKKEKPGLRTLVTSLITFCIEWDYRNEHFEYFVKSGTVEPFFLHLFRGCLLFESLIKHNRCIEISEPTLNPILNKPSIKEKLGIPQIEGRGREKDFTLQDIFDALVNYNNTIHEAIKITYMARNTLGHNLGWDTPIDQKQYQKLFFIIVSSCLHVVNCLWKPTDG